MISKTSKTHTNEAKQEDTAKARPYAKKFSQPSLAKQSFKDQANINTIVKKYQQTGTLPINKQNAQYLQNSGQTFNETMQLVAKAKEAFLQVPSDIRRKFKDDPQEFIEFINNPENHEEAMDMGILEDTRPPPKKPETPPEPPAEPPEKASPAPEGGEKDA